MKKYIDTEKLIAEIERLKSQLIRGACAAQIEMETNCKDEAYNEVLAVIDSLQREQHGTNRDDRRFVNISVRKELAELFQKLGDEVKAGQSSFIEAINHRE